VRGGAHLGLVKPLPRDGLTTPPRAPPAGGAVIAEVSALVPSQIAARPCARRAGAACVEVVAAVVAALAVVAEEGWVVELGGGHSSRRAPMCAAVARAGHLGRG